MTDVQQPQQLWSDENIMNDARRATSNPTAQAQIRNCLLFMRHGYEADRQQLTARIQELERELAELRRQRWEPVEDGEYDMGGDEPLYIFGNTDPEVCTHVEYQNDSVMLDLGMTVCRLAPQEQEGDE